MWRREGERATGAFGYQNNSCLRNQYKGYRPILSKPKMPVRMFVRPFVVASRLAASGHLRSRRMHQQFNAPHCAINRRANTDVRTGRGALWCVISRQWHFKIRRQSGVKAHSKRWGNGNKMGYVFFFIHPTFRSISHALSKIQRLHRGV